MVKRKPFSIQATKGKQALVKAVKFMSPSGNIFLKSVGQGFIDVYSKKRSIRTKKRLKL